MLSPSKKDPNCKKEEKRKKEHPEDFGNFSGNKKPKDFKLGVGLKKASTDTEEEIEVPVVLTAEERIIKITDVINLLEEGNVEHIAVSGLPVFATVQGLTGIEDLSEEELVNTFLEVKEITLDEIKLQSLVTAISNLEEGNEEHFTGDGAPRVEVLEANTGYVSVTADERNAAFEIFTENKDKEGGFLSFFKKK